MVQIGIDVYISQHKHLVKPHLSPWFSAACAATIVQRNHLCMKKLVYTTKTKESITFQKLGSEYLPVVFPTKKNVIPPLFNHHEVLSSASDKAKLFAKNFFKNSNFND